MTKEKANSTYRGIFFVIRMFFSHGGRILRHPSSSIRMIALLGCGRV